MTRKSVLPNVVGLAWRAVFVAVIAWPILAHGQLQGVGYRLAPGAAYMSFDDNAGLEDGFLFGGTLGLSFGEFLELGVGYFVAPQLRTDFSRFTGLEEAPHIAEGLAALPQQQVRLQRLGTELQLRLTRGGLAPYLIGGAGVVRFEPERTGRSDNIFLSGGGGVQLTGAGRYALAAQVALLTYRYNPGTTFFTAADLAEVGLTYESFNEVQVRNLSAMATLRLYLGGRRPGELTDADRAYLEQFAGGLRGLSLQVEPFASRLLFDEALPFTNQSFAGVEAGLDFGPLIGVRGFYARGVDTDEATSLAPIQMYGGHLQLRLSEGRGLVPYLILGGGYLDVLEGYEPPPSPVIEIPGAQPQPSDRPFVVGGAGFVLPLDARLRLLADARAVIMADHEHGDVSRPEQLHVSPMLRLGLAFGIGGRRPAAPVAVPHDEPDRRIGAAREAAALRVARLEDEIARARARDDAEAVARLRAEQRRELALVIDEPEAVVRPPEPIAEAVPPRREPQFVTFPVPERGEIFIRYGDPVAPAPGIAAAPATEEALRALVREAIREAMGETPAVGVAADAQLRAAIEELLRRELARDQADLTAAERQLLERRLIDRLFDELRVLRAEIRGVRDARPIVIRPPRVVIPPHPDVVPRAQRFTGIVAALPIAGFAAGRGANPLNFGFRIDYRTAGSPVRYYPELLFGIVGRSSVALNLNAAVPLPQIGADTFPYAGIGVGIISQAPRDAIKKDPIGGPVVTEEGRRSFLLGLNLLLGAELELGSQRIFGEVAAINLTRMFRMMGGYRFTF